MIFGNKEQILYGNRFNGTKGNGYQPIKKEQTNFDNITKSVETLASWLDEHMEFCDEIPCDECCEYKECWHQGCDVDFSSNAKRWEMWLKQPHREENEK